MTTQTVTDIAALVGEMEAPECEHSQHGRAHPLHGGGASDYVRGIHGCVPPTNAYAACARMVSAIRSGMFLRCGGCGEIAAITEMYEILGPVNK